MALTAVAPTLIGRSAELGRARALLAGGRLVTLVGPPGIGKSALAEAVVRERRDGVSVDASACRDAAVLARRVGRAVGVAPARAMGVLLARAASRLDEHGRLLLLDDVDTPEGAASVVAALLAASTRARVLVTSRAPLGLPGEHLVDVGPLDLASASELFRLRAGAAVDEACVRAVVERLDRVPLAVVLAAGRTSVLSAEELLERLDEPLRVLRADARVSGIRHAALEDAIASAVDLLPEGEARALRAAALFEGTFSAESFEAVLGDAAELDPLDALAALVRRSLVERRPGRGAAHFRVLHLVRAYARARAVDPGGAIRGRYEAHVATLAEAAARACYGPRAARALEDLARAAPDVVAAFDASVASRPGQAAALWVALFDAILFAEAVPLDDRRFAEAVDAADRAQDMRLRVRTRVLRARAALEVGPPDGAEADLRAALALAADDPLLTAEVQRSLGWMELGRGRLERAATVLEQALATSAAARDVRGHADALAALGIAEHLRGRAAQARESLTLARALHEVEKDAPRRERVDEMLRLLFGEAATPPAASLEAAALRHEARGQRWRLAIDLALLAERERRRGCDAEAGELRARARAAARLAGLPGLEAAVEGSARSAPAASPAWVAGPETRWIARTGGARVDLQRHGSLRRVLDVLVTARLERPGQALSAGELLAAAWPGERMLHEAGLLRVYSAVRRLRRMGLEGALLTRDDGYLWDPAAAVERAPG